MVTQEAQVKTLDDQQAEMNAKLDTLVKQVKKLARIENERLKQELKMLSSLSLTGLDRANAERFKIDEILTLNKLEDLLGNI